MKRVDLLVRALAHTRTPVRVGRSRGRGPEREALERLVAELGVQARVDLLGWVDDERLVDLYAGSLRGVPTRRSTRITATSPWKRSGRASPW